MVSSNLETQDLITFWLVEIVLISGREGMIGIVKGGLVREMEKEGEGEKRERERDCVREEEGRVSGIRGEGVACNLTS